MYRKEANMHHLSLTAVTFRSSRIWGRLIRGMTLQTHSSEGAEAWFWSQTFSSIVKEQSRAEQAGLSRRAGSDGLRLRRLAMTVQTQRVLVCHQPPLFLHRLCIPPVHCQGILIRSKWDGFKCSSHFSVSPSTSPDWIRSLLLCCLTDPWKSSPGHWK